ncbi:hypothetical protein HDC90_001422 [Pedobacter sp. AK013]|nr:hypothetical protein [Pedobacter sp. AK013]
MHLAVINLSRPINSLSPFTKNVYIIIALQLGQATGGRLIDPPRNYELSKPMTIEPMSILSLIFAHA